VYTCQFFNRLIRNFLSHISDLKLIRNTSVIKNAGDDVSLVLFCKSLVKSRVVLEYSYLIICTLTNVCYFVWRWGVGAILVTRTKSENLVFNF